MTREGVVVAGVGVLLLLGAGAALLALTSPRVEQGLYGPIYRDRWTGALRGPPGDRYATRHSVITGDTLHTMPPEWYAAGQDPGQQVAAGMGGYVATNPVGVGPIISADFAEDARARLQRDLAAAGINYTLPEL